MRHLTKNLTVFKQLILAWLGCRQSMGTTSSKDWLSFTLVWINMLADVWNLYPCTNRSTKSQLIWLLLGGLSDFSFCLSLSELLSTGASMVTIVKLSRRYYVNLNFKTRQSTKNVEPRMWSNQLFQYWEQSLAIARLEISPQTHNDLNQRIVSYHPHMPFGGS